MPSRPNVLFIITDHTRAAALRDPQCLTPNLDALAAEGVRFERAYTVNAICSPSRATLMTGLYPSTHGVWDCTHTQPGQWVDVRNDPPFWSRRLRQAGYATGYFGKWHVEQSHRLEQFGWQSADESCAHYDTQPLESPRIVGRTAGYKDLLLMGVDAEADGPARHPAFEKALAHIRACAGGEAPFCCFVSSAEPHDPYVPPKRFFDLYDPSAMELPATLRGSTQGKPDAVRRMRGVWAGLTDDDWRMIKAAYYASITFLDHEVGRLVQALKQAGAYENTWIVFTADHGDMLGSHGLFAKGVTPYEPVYNIPLVMRGPGVSPRAAAGAERALVSLVDLAPTLTDLCGVAPLEGAQGRSLRGLLEATDEPALWQDAYAEYYGQRFLQTQRIVWHGDWKYVFSPTAVDELYHLAADPEERDNLAEDPAYRDKLIEMTQRMWRKLAEVGDRSLLQTDYPTLRVAPVGPR